MIGSTVNLMNNKNTTDSLLICEESKILVLIFLTICTFKNRQVIHGENCSLIIQSFVTKITIFDTKITSIQFTKNHNQNPLVIVDILPPQNIHINIKLIIGSIYPIHKSVSQSSVSWEFRNNLVSGLNLVIESSKEFDLTTDATDFLRRRTDELLPLWKSDVSS